MLAVWAVRATSKRVRVRTPVVQGPSLVFAAKTGLAIFVLAQKEQFIFRFSKPIPLEPNRFADRQNYRKMNYPYERYDPPPPPPSGMC